MITPAWATKIGFGERERERERGERESTDGYAD